MMTQEKADYVASVLSEVSEQGQIYLKNLAQAMLYVQETIVSPLSNGNEPIEGADRGEDLR